ncbi:MAG: glycosyltransferase family 87 protein [Rickettsiella sp.]|nr:glycosyltransferase family 87 protein [Rickettsiella sp.]
MPKKISCFLLSLLGIAILSGLFSLNYTYPLTLGKSSILYSDYGKFYHSQRQFIAGKNIYAPVYFIKNKKHTEPGHSLLSKPAIKPKRIGYVDHCAKANKKAAFFDYRNPAHPGSVSNETQKKDAFPPSSCNDQRKLILAGNLNPPLFTLITFPIAYLSYPHALLLWTFFSMLAGCIAILLIQQKLEPRSILSLQTSLLLLIGFMCYFPTFVTLQFGQVSLLLLPLLVLGWRAAHDQKSTRAAVYLGLAASLKPFIGLFLVYFFIRKEWRALLAFISIILLSVFLTAVFFGIDTYYSYYQVCHQIAWAASSWNVSIYGFLLRLIGGPEANTPLIAIPGLFNVAYLFLSILLLLALVLFLRPLACIANLQKKTDIDFSIILVVMLLLSPLGWMYYFPFLSIPFLILWDLSKKGIYPIGLPLILATLLLICNIPIILTPTNEIQSNNAISVFLGSSLYFSVLIGLMVLLFVIRFILSKKLIQNKPLQVFEKIPHSLLLLVCAIAFLPSLLGITKTCSTWIRYAINYNTEYILISQD